MNEYPSRAKTRKYFLAAVLLFVLQLILGIFLSIEFMFRGEYLFSFPFDIYKSLHLNVMVLWLLLGFIGGLYYLLPPEVGRDIKYPRLIDFQFWFLMIAGIGIIISELSLPAETGCLLKAGNIWKQEEHGTFFSHLDCSLWSSMWG